MDRQLNTIFMTLFQIMLNCVLRLCFEAMKVLLVFLFTISETRLFLNKATLGPLPLKFRDLDFYYMNLSFFVIQVFLRRAYSDVDIRGHSSRTALHIAADMDKVSICKLLVSNFKPFSC